LIAVPRVRETEIAGIQEEAAFRTKIPTKVLAGSSIDNTTT
jgi:hypothetical protein